MHTTKDIDELEVKWERELSRLTLDTLFKQENDEVVIYLKEEELFRGLCFGQENQEFNFEFTEFKIY